MNLINKSYIREVYHINDNGIFPNSELPVIIYKRVLDLPYLFASNAVRKLFKSNNWKNSWKSGVFEYHHYHSITHEVMGVAGGSTTILFGGDSGIKIVIEKGDVIIIPAGVAHKNLGKQNQVTCIGAYPEGKEYDMNYGKPGERPATDNKVKQAPRPLTDPVFGVNAGIAEYWK
ncbi:MAG: cupin protein [Bacteroidetes bacterium]|nr:cupin protein [Bacteroidota bacterium]